MLSDRCAFSLSVLSVLSVCYVGVLWPNGWMNQDATWYRGRPRHRRHCVRWGFQFPMPNGKRQSSPPHFMAHVYCGQTVAHLSNCWALVTSQISFLSLNQRRQGTEWNSEHWPQPAAWTHPFFIHHQAPDGRGVAPCMPALRRRQLFYGYWRCDKDLLITQVTPQFLRVCLYRHRSGLLTFVDLGTSVLVPRCIITTHTHTRAHTHI